MGLPLTPTFGCAPIPVVPPPPATAPTCLIPAASPLPPPPASDVTEILPRASCRQPSSKLLFDNSVEFLAEASMLHSQSAPATPRSLVLSMYPPVAPPPSPEADLLGKMLSNPL